MRILVLVTGIDSDGGIQIFNRFLIKGLLDLGHQIEVISINDRQLPASREYPFFSCAQWKLLRKGAFVLQALKQSKKFRPELIICGHINFSFLCLLLKTFFRKPYFTVAHGIEAWNLKALNKMGVMRSTRILAVSNFTRRKILEQLPAYPPKALCVQANTFDAEKFIPGNKDPQLMQKLGIKDQDKIILTVARISKKEKYKGYDLLISVMNEVLREVPEAKYLLVGSGSDIHRVRRLIEKNNLQERVILAGRVSHEDIRRYYNLCDCFVMPSHGEGFGVVFLEALACGKMVIAGDRDASREALLDQELGILVNPFDSQEIRKAVIEALKRDVPDKLLDGAYLRQRVVEAFGYRVFRDHLESIVSPDTLKPAEHIPATLVIRPIKGWVAIDFKELWQYRELLLFLVWRDIKVRYKQTILGASWAVIQPILMMVVFSLFFGKFMKVPRVGIPYPLFSYSAILPWMLFSEGVNRSANSLTQGAGILTKVYFPRLIMPIAGVISPVVDFLFSILVYFGLMFYYGFEVGPAIFLLPVFVLMAMITALAVGLWMAALNAQYRDVRYVIPFLMQFWFFASPVVYSSITMSKNWQFLYSLNPMVGIIEGFRWILLGTEPPGQLMISSLVATVFIMIWGVFYFRKKEKIFVDVV